MEGTTYHYIAAIRVGRFQASSPPGPTSGRLFALLLPLLLLALFLAASTARCAGPGATASAVRMVCSTGLFACRRAGIARRSDAQVPCTHVHSLHPPRFDGLDGLTPGGVSSTLATAAHASGISLINNGTHRVRLSIVQKLQWHRGVDAFGELGELQYMPHGNVSRSQSAGSPAYHRTR